MCVQNVCKSMYSIEEGTEAGEGEEKVVWRKESEFRIP